MAYTGNLVGQATFTSTQLAQLQTLDRYTDGTGKYISDDFASSGYYGGGNLVYQGAEEFLIDVELTGDFTYRWTWFDTTGGAIVIGIGNCGNCEPLPVHQPSPEKNDSSYNLDYIHYAAILSKIWDGDATSEDFNGQTKSRDLHALDLARAVFEICVLTANESSINFWNTTKYPRVKDQGNPIFIYASAPAKYMDSYALVQSQIVTDAFYLANYVSVEYWFEGAKDYWMGKHKAQHFEVFGADLPDDVTPATIEGRPSSAFYGSIRDYSFRDSGGTPQADYAHSWAARSVVSNQNLDMIAMVGQYGVLFNDTEAKDFAFQNFKLFLEIAIFPDGTYGELSRSTGTDNSTKATGIHYWNITNYHVIKMAYQHAVAVENGLTGVTDKGLFFDYTTSRGSDEIWSGVAASEFSAGNTSGGPKGLKMMLLRFSDHFKTAANGGVQDIRFGSGGLSVNDDFISAQTVVSAMANVYYEDTTLKNFYLGTAPFQSGPGISDNNVTVTNAGPYKEHSIGTSWGESGSYLGGYTGIAEMEDYVFQVTPINTTPVITLIGNSQTRLNVGSSYIEQGATAFDLEDGDISGNIIIGGDSVNTSIEGTYIITYDVQDSGLLNAIQKIRVVDVRAPQIGVLLRGLSLGTTASNVGYIGTNKLRG